MAKGRVSGGTPLNIKANLDINQAKKNALDMIKTLNDIKTAASTSGMNPTTGTAKIYDVKPLNEYQAGLLKIKQEALDLAKQNVAKAEERRSQLDAEKKAAQEKSSAEKSASLAIQAALKEETRIKREQIALQKEQAILARKTGPFPGGFAERQFQNPPKLGSEPVKNLTLSYSELIKKYNAQTNSIDANNVAYSKLSTELAKQAAAQGNLTNGVLTSTTALRQNSSAEDDSYVKKGKSALLIAEQTAIQAKATAELKNFVRETNNEKGSLEQRKAALVRLTIEYGKLTVAQRNSSSGTRLANTITGLTNQIKDIQKFGSEANIASGKIVDLKNKIAFFQDALTRAQAPQSFVNLNRKIEETRLALERLNNAGKKGFDSLGNKDPFDAAKTRQATADLKNYVRETGNAKGSIEQRKAALERLSNAYVKLSAVERDSAAGTRMAKIIKDLTEKIKELEAALGKGSSSGSSDFFTSIKDNIMGVIGPLALLTAAYQSIKELFAHNVEISDNFVDVQRTAKLSADEVDKLGDKLKNINTRTSLEGLLDIGFEGGRLGVAKDDLVGFITTVDQLAVVLKKELPGGAEAVAESLGKIVKIYKVSENEGISLGDAMNKVGSSLLELAHSGGVTVKYLQDFTLGVAGTAVTAKLSLPVIEAYGAVMSNAGTIASSASISLTRVVNDLSSKRGKYFAIAQLEDSTLTIDKFNNLINTDTQAALALFFKGLKAGNPTQIEFNDRIKSVGINTGKVNNAVKVMANNFGLLEEKLAISTKGYNEATSVTHNFELANNSLAASIEKIKNSVVNAFTSSGFARSLGNLLNAVTDNRTETEKLTEEYNNNKHSLDELDKSSKPLLEKYDQLKSKSNLTKIEQEDLRSVTAKLGELYPGVITNMNNFGIALDINRGKITEMSKAQREMLELQNRSAIQAAKTQFNLAQSYIPEAKKNAVTSKKTNGVYDAVYDFLYGGDRKTEAETNAKDRVTRLSATSYEAAKAVRDLGGTLTAAEKKVIDYYEALDKAKNPVKKSEVLGTGELVDENIEAIRTPNVIKAELKTLLLANASLGIATDQFKANVDKIKALRKELKLANGGKDTEGIRAENQYQAAVTARNSLQEKITQLTNAGLNKQLSADDAEVDSVREKYRKMGADIEEFNRKYKGKVKVDSSGLVTAEKTEVQGAIDKQSNGIFKAQLADQTKDFEEFENYRLKYGEEKAKERYKTEYTTAEAYAQKLEDVQTDILNKYGDPSGYSEAQKQELDIATNEIIAFNEKRKGIDDESYSRAYEAALTNAQKIDQINKEYELNRIALGKNATTEQLANLQRERDEKIRGQNEANAQQASGYEELMQKYDEMTRDQIIRELNAIKKKNSLLYENGKITAEQLANLNRTVDQGIQTLNGNNVFNNIGESIKNYREAVRILGKDSEGAKDAQRKMYNAIAEGAEAASVGVSGLADVFDQLGVGGEKLQQVMKGVSGIIGGAGQIAKGIAQKDPVAIVTGSIKLLTSAINLFNNKDKNLQKKIDGYKKQLDDLGNSYKQLERQVANSVGESVYSDQAKEIENLQKQQQLLIQSRDAEGQKKKKDQGKIDEYNNQINDIPNKIDDINKAISQNLIQGTFKDLSNSLADAFAEAFKAGENGIEKMDDVFKNFIGNAIKNSLKLKILDPVVKNFTDDLTQYAKDNNNSIVGFDFDKWKSQLKEAGDQFNAGLKVSEQFFKPDSEKPSSVGTIRAELTEQTGGKLEGLWRGQFDMTKSLVALSTERNAILIPIGKSIGDYFNLARASFDVIVQTEVNTRRTADNTDDLSKKLDQIISNTKGGPTARGSGYQSI